MNMDASHILQTREDISILFQILDSSQIKYNTNLRISPGTQAFPTNHSIHEQLTIYI